MTALFYLLLMQMTRPFVFKDIASVRILVDTFKVFSCFSRLKGNISKCEIASFRNPERGPGGSLWFTKY